jgi:hypothetical protein
MEATPDRPSRWILICALSIVFAIGVGIAFHFLSRQNPLSSPPTAVRPWAKAHFLQLTKPVRSAGKPADPQYQARHSGVGPSKGRSYRVALEFERPATEFVPDYEVIEFDAADGFTAKSGSGAIRWLAAKPYDLPPNYGDDPGASVLTPFHPDGRPMRQDDVKAMGLTKQDFEGWGWELNGEFGSAMKGVLTLKGYENLQGKFQDIIDAATHISVRQNASLQPANDGLSFAASLAIVHDAPLLAVIDLAHGETEDFNLPVTKGARVSHADFSFEIIDVSEGMVTSGGSGPVRSGKSIEVKYSSDTSATRADNFSVIYQINPPSMTTAVSVDAIDGTGNVIKNHGRFMEDTVPVSRFGAPLATAASLRVRYRPHQTRLLLKMKSLPGATGPNIAPADLFDVRAPRITIRDSYQMRRIITDGSQFKDITGSWSYDTPAAFPMTLTNVSLRHVAERYLALDHGRTIEIDHAAMTLKFEPPKDETFIGKIVEWFKRPHWGP